MNILHDGNEIAPSGPAPDYGTEYAIAPIVPAPLPDPLAFPMALQWQWEGAAVGDSGARVVNFVTGDDCVITRGVGENANVITIRKGLLTSNHVAETVALADEATATRSYEVVMLLHFEGADGSTTFVDEAGHAFALYHVPSFPVEVGAIRTASPIMGSSSFVTQLYGTSGSFSNIALTASSSPDFDLPTDFTIEFSCICTVSAFADHVVLARGSIDAYDYVGGATNNLLWSCSLNPPNFTFEAPGLGGPTALTCTHSNGVLQRYAVTREGSTLRLYKEGVLEDTVTGYTQDLSWGAHAGTGNLTVGGPYQTFSPLPNDWVSGKFDEIRITRGLARYTGASYTLAVAPFPYPDPP